MMYTATSPHVFAHVYFSTDSGTDLGNLSTASQGAVTRLRSADLRGSKARFAVAVRRQLSHGHWSTHQNLSIGDTKEEMKKFGSDLFSMRLYQHPNKKPARHTMAGM